MPGGGIHWVKKQFCDLTDLFFPPVCPVCLAPHPEYPANPFCLSCLSGLNPLPRGRCSCCALPFVASTNSGHLCADCSRQQPPFSAVHAAGLYDGTLKQALQRFKYSGVVDLDRPLAKLLLEQLPELNGSEIIVPVPLHPQRLRQRGYNQSLLLAKALAYNLQNPLEQAMLVRTLNSHSQQGLDARQRALNLCGAFSCSHNLSGEAVLLIDDVMTTGATLASCSQVLLEAGAQKVIAGVVARAPRH